MLPKPAGGTRVNLSFIALKRKACQDLGGDVVAGVPQPLMPQGGRRGGAECLVRKTEWVEIARTVTSEHLHPGRKILDRKTTWVKLDRYIVITS